ncbi:MAG: AbrB/MazE/SpoVT family DNA-binding domain-containing protein [Kosmotogaceae bacterium]
MSLKLGRSVITGKGQVQIPAKIRQALGLNIGDEVAFKLDDEGKVEIEFTRKRPLTEFAGSLKLRKDFPGLEEEESAARQLVAESAAEDYE